MNHGIQAAGSDRLPWLPDERRAPRIGGVAIILAIAVWVVVVVAAVSYSPWPINFDLDNFRPMARRGQEAPVARRVQHPAEMYGNLQIVPAPAPAAPTAGAVVPPPDPPAISPPVAGAKSPPGASPAAAAEAPASSSETPESAAEAASPAAQSEGQDCRLAKTRAALALCNNQRLAALDREHALIYNQSWRYADAAKRAQLQRARQKMTTSIDACQTDACASAAYLAAMRQVSAIMSAKRAPAAAKPSFNCSGARKPGQITVCNDPNLAALDQHQALLYSQSWGRADRARRAQLQRAQRRLIAQRDKCASEQCAKSVYLAAMKEVTEIMTQN